VGTQGGADGEKVLKPSQLGALFIVAGFLLLAVRLHPRGGVRRTGLHRGELHQVEPLVAALAAAAGRDASGPLEARRGFSPIVDPATLGRWLATILAGLIR